MIWEKRNRKCVSYLLLTLLSLGGICTCITKHDTIDPNDLNPEKVKTTKLPGFAFYIKDLRDGKTSSSVSAIRNDMVILKEEKQEFYIEVDPRIGEFVRNTFERHEEVEVILEFQSFTLTADNLYLNKDQSKEKYDRQNTIQRFVNERKLLLRENIKEIQVGKAKITQEQIKSHYGITLSSIYDEKKAQYAKIEDAKEFIKAKQKLLDILTAKEAIRIDLESIIGKEITNIPPENLLDADGNQIIDSKGQGIQIRKTEQIKFALMLNLILKVRDIERVYRSYTMPMAFTKEKHDDFFITMQRRRYVS